MRYRLRTLLIAGVLCAILANAIASERHATKKIIELEAAVMTALAKLNPEVSEWFDVDYLNDGDDELSSYHFSSDTINGAVGPGGIHRVVRVGEQAEIVIRIEARWYCLWCGTPKIVVNATQCRGDRWLAKRLEAELVASLGEADVVAAKDQARDKFPISNE